MSPFYILIIVMPCKGYRERERHVEPIKYLSSSSNRHVFRFGRNVICGISREKRRKLGYSAVISDLMLFAVRDPSALGLKSREGHVRGRKCVGHCTLWNSLYVGGALESDIR